MKEDRAIARSLVNMGVSAIPAIEEAMHSVERQGDESRFSFNSGWLVLAYARIKGEAALPLIRRMIGNPKLDFLQVGLEQAAALSLNITSYVSGSREPLPVLHCSRGEEPRDALDQLILAWERDDRSWLEASLGAGARTALKSLLNAGAWAAIRAQSGHGNSGGVALGYQFVGPGRWAEPDETLDEGRGYGNVALDTGDLQFETHFKNSSGADCGTSVVSFVKVPTPVAPGYLGYLVDSSKLDDLLRLIGHCANE
jgi:hypothetical protein